MADSYKVTNQRQTTALTNGQFVDVEEITFQTTSGTTGSVKIPISRLKTVDYVKEVIETRVAALDAVRKL